MLIVISGGNSGIKDYLENGQKKDRFYSRDELDQRLILNGDLDTVENLIDVMNKQDVTRDKYLHITLSFKEDYVNEEMLSSIVNEFRDFYFKAYSSDEFHYYAEAHLPKIKSYIDAKTGDVIIRKPHIHVVIPTINLLTGNGLNPRVEYDINYIDAFQEYINVKYGLESPKDNPRYHINDNSEFISRYKGDGFKGKGREVREKIFDDILSKNIGSFNQLHDYLVNNGYAVKVRNLGKGSDKEYFNIIDTDGNSINLRDKVFMSDYLALDTNSKFNTIKDDIRYIEPVKNIDTLDSKYTELLTKWDKYKAYEYKYVYTKLSGTSLARYEKLSQPEKEKYISEQIKQSNNKNLGSDNGQLTDRGIKEPESGEFSGACIDAISQNIRAASESINSAGAAFRGSGSNQGRIINRDRRIRIAKHYARITGRDKPEVGRNISKYSGNKENWRSGTKCNYIDGQYQGLLSKLQLSKAEFKVATEKFNIEIQADVLLELLEKTHGVHPELYRIVKASDGNDRINCGTRNLNIMDFCVKEMGFSLDETYSVLDNVHVMQQEVNRERGWKPESAKYLADEYKEWFKSYKAERAKTTLANVGNFKANRSEIVQLYKNKVAQVKANEKLRFYEKRDQFNILKVEKLLELDALAKARNAAAINVKQAYNLEMQQAYRKFLTEKAHANDDVALQELRRLRINYQDIKNNDSFNYVDRYEEFKLKLTHVIDKDGVINYQLNNSTILRDHGKRVSVVKYSNDNIKLTLDLAMQKFGSNISLTGSDKFRQRAVDIAISNNYKINFTDEFSHNYYKQRISELQKADNQLIDDKLAIIADKPKYLYVTGTKEAELVNDKGRYTKAYAITMVDYKSKKAYTVTGHKINFAAKSLVPGQFIDTFVDATGDLVVKESSIDKQIRKLKTDTVAATKKWFIASIKEKHAVGALKQEITGKLIKTGELKDKFYALVVANGEYKRIFNNDLKSILTKENISKGDTLTIAIPATKAVEQKTESEVIKITRSQPVLDDLLLEIELENGSENYKSEYLGRVTEIKSITLKSGKETNVVLVNDIIGGKQSKLYIDDVQSLKINDFAYFGEKGFNEFNIEIKNDRLEQKRQKLFSEYGIKDAVIADISSIGFKNIRGREVFFTELRTENGLMIKYGEKIRAEIERNALKAGDSILLTTKVEQGIKVVEENIIEVKNLEQDIDAAIDLQLEKMLDDIEFEQNKTDTELE